MSGCQQKQVRTGKRAFLAEGSTLWQKRAADGWCWLSGSLPSKQLRAVLTVSDGGPGLAASGTDERGRLPELQAAAADIKAPARGKTKAAILE